ncbi:MAG: hypothetical protein HN580_15140 [Deltaproteobacteria bacterium]|jgi:Na+/H+ antiporter NhaD/arsenite permease-like protein|nr:hypothetical protein [Deltaproteobacteria bacterium]MBT4638949.1 hypothetical protein [Deltaproteobacteria bacterium]MBT6504772.1 hypothetical protein [Deltaproteobacteria bacterium]MBT6613650.1 hypothetical protein [Deltaproteobacteria bacterium]MBT7152114.1 hypothetical protein [Deltaproteobacteria bacterium]
MKKKGILVVCTMLFLFALPPLLTIASVGELSGTTAFPKPLDSYHDSHLTDVGDILIHRIKQEPLNLVVSILFLCAIIHTFCVGTFRRMAEKLEKKHRQLLKINGQANLKYNGNPVDNVSFGAELCYFLGEVEIVFGMWVVPVFWITAYTYGWNTSVHYFNSVNFTEPIFVLVIMILASTRPIMRFSENCLSLIAQVGKSTTAAWWFTVLTVGPILGSFITEPGAMTISSLILAKQFYERRPSLKFAYATIGLLFVNISVGGTLTHFAAPPVLMVAGKWNWDFYFMLTNFGWKAVIGIFVANILYFWIFRSELKKMDSVKLERSPDDLLDWDQREEKIPVLITVFHIVFLAWTVLTGHYPALFIPGFFLFLGFRRATQHHQNETNLKPALLVACFLAALVAHGGLQGWWIAPILSSLSEVPLMLGATFLTAFNDNAAITYLSSLVPNFSESMKYAVVAGAVTGGGLTVIANAPNPAGISILRGFFTYGVSPMRLALGAMIPTIIMGLAFMLLP